MKPHVAPSAIGDPCWSRPSVEARLAPIAQVSDSQVDWFLATHTPIQCQASTGEQVSEADLFQRLFHSGSPEQLVVIKGPPGAGKSQLINWLRLRFEDAVARNEPRTAGTGRLRTVLIRRRSGSLKDALEQLVSQLPEYERFLGDVKTAIAQISDDQARRKLSFEISVVLCGLQQKGGLPADLEHLDQIFQDIRMTEMMCRPDGTIDRNIQRLTSESDDQARESLPTFSPEDFDFRGKRRGQEVDTLMLDLLEDEEGLRVEAAKIANSVLREALANVTGIKGQTLHEVFRRIRRAMSQAGEELALFIEDVSTMSILDEELINALEPQGDTGLCRTLSVVGMTVPAYNRLQENKKDRITLALEIQGDIGRNGALADEERADQFVARYLNALRASDDDVARLAEDRREHGDVLHSACEGCGLRDACFDAFSSAKIGEVEIGLYPLARGAAFRLLEGLEVSSSSRNPRGLLRHVVLPLLESHGSKSQGRSSSFGINLKPRVPSDLAQATQTVLGGWDITRKNQLTYLAWYWAAASTVADARGALEPMLPWLGLPPFVGQPERTKPPAPSPVGPTPTKPQPATRISGTVVPAGLVAARQRLQEWFDQGKPLAKDAEYRELLLDVVRNSLDEENTRTPSFAMQELASGGKPLTTTNIYIEDMVSRSTAGSIVRFNFLRGQPSYELLYALLDFQYLGGRTWSFEGGPAQRRVLSKWLRRHRDDMLRSYNVTKVATPEVEAVAAAFLVIAYRYCRRITLPSDTAGAIEALTSWEPSEPVAIAPLARNLASDLVSRVAKMRLFLLRQLSVPQGGARSVAFIDSRVIQEAVTLYREASELPSLDRPDLQSDFPEVYRLLRSDWSRLAEALSQEHQQVVDRLGALRSIAARWDIEPEEAQDESDELTRCMRTFLQSARAVAKACAAAKHSLGNADLQARVEDLPSAKIATWLAGLPEAVAAEKAGPAGILSVDVDRLLRLHAFVLEIDKTMGQLAADLAAQMSDVTTQAEVDAERARAKEVVKRLSEYAAESTSAQEDGRAIDE